MDTENSVKIEDVKDISESQKAKAVEINVLEAIAKYNEKKKSEKEQSSKFISKSSQASSPSVSAPSQDKIDGKYNQKKKFGKERRGKFTPRNSHQDSPPSGLHTKRKLQENVVVRNETELGIQEFIHKSKGFSAILKQRYSDFQVNEIDLEGNVVHLTNHEIPELPVETDINVDTDVLTTDQWESIDAMMKSDEPEGKITVEFEVTEKSKEQRIQIHKALRFKYPSSIASNSEKKEDGKSVMKIFKLKPGKTDGHRRGGPPFIKFVMFKENLSTMEAIGILARNTRTNKKDDVFQYAGTKDKRGVTSQLVSAKKFDAKKLLNSMRGEKRVQVGNLSFSQEPLRLGDLKGNRFRIVLRNVVGDQKEIVKSLESLRDVGFINYYGSQRFGTRDIPTHHVGIQLLLGNWQKAIDLILEPPTINCEDKYQKDYDLVLARNAYFETRDAAKACNKLTRSKHAIEAQLLFSLKTKGNDLVGALNSLPRNLRLTYIHAYQSFLWNMVVSKRLATFGLKPVVGDLVCVGEEEMIPSETTDGETAEDQPPAAVSEPTNGPSRKKKKVIILDESNVQDYTIYNVVLPLPGYDVMYPTHEAAKWYQDLLAADGLAENGFTQSVKSYNLGGDYRPIMAKPDNLKWEFLRYDDPTISLIVSDLEKMKNESVLPPRVEDGQFTALVLEFDLPSSSYATMALREITKLDMSSGFQTSLNEGGTKKEEPPVKRPKKDEEKPTLTEESMIKTEPEEVMEA